MVAVANDLIPDGVATSVLTGRDVFTVSAVLREAILHRAADGCTCGDKRLLLAGIHKVFLCGRRRDLTIGLVYLQSNAFRGDVAIAADFAAECIAACIQPNSSIINGFAGTCNFSIALIPLIRNFAVRI